MKEKYFKVSCQDCDYTDQALYPYQKKAVREMARHHARHFKHIIKETETVINFYSKA